MNMATSMLEETSGMSCSVCPLIARAVALWWSVLDMRASDLRKRSVSLICRLPSAAPISACWDFCLWGLFLGIVEVCRHVRHGFVGLLWDVWSVRGLRHCVVHHFCCLDGRRLNIPPPLPTRAVLKLWFAVRVPRDPGVLSVFHGFDAPSVDGIVHHGFLHSRSALRWAGFRW